MLELYDFPKELPVNCLHGAEVNFEFQIAGVDYYMSGNHRRQSGLKETCGLVGKFGIFHFGLETIALEDAI